MPVEPFLDTNILVYSVVPGDPRHGRARELLGAGGFVSVQVLNEFVNVARRKMKLAWPDIQSALVDFQLLLDPAVELTRDQQKAAVAIAQAYGFHISDAMIVASALDAGCTILYTEDLQHGQNVSGLRVTNPFL